MKKFFVLLFGLIILIVIGGCQSLVDFFPFLNRAPIIISEPAITATENNQYSYQLEAKDLDGDTLTYLLVLCPEGMSINSENGLITWIPTNNQVGIHQIIVKTSDGKLSDTQNYEIEVINVNNPPQILSYSPANINIKTNEGNSVKFEIQAQDIDLNTTLNYQWLLNGKKVSSSTGSGNNSKSSWIYSASYGDYSQKIVKILVNDGELEDNIKWNITVGDITPPAQPILNTITSPTNISPQILSGTKEPNTSIWINGAEVVPLDSSVDWSHFYNLSEGINNISITSRDIAGNKSSAITTTIEYDPNIFVDAANATGTEDGTETHPFNTITEGINAVTSGKSVMVAAGTYNEQLIINKGITLQGAGKESTSITIIVEYIGNLITVTADDVTISGFNIDGKSNADIGIYSDSSSSIEISENIIQNHQDSGIFYHRTSDDYPSGIYVYNNEICFNSKNGIKVTGEGSGIIEGNTIRKNIDGIRAYNNASLEIKHNNITDNTSTGILCQDNSSLLIWGNEIIINDYGIKVGALSSDTTKPDIGGGIKSGVGQNKIAGNKTHGVSNKTTHNIIAKNNWWGDAAGPKYPGNPNNATISGDWAYWSETGGDIIFNPPLTVEP